jgi:DNA modification methylase
MNNQIIQGDCLEVLKGLPDSSVHCCVTSPPYYGLRDYGVDGQIGLEETPDAYVARLVEVFREVRRVMRDDGTLWVNLGDSHAATRGNQRPPSNTRNKGHNLGSSRVPLGWKPKDLFGIPWRVAFALQADGWYLRQDIIWHKPNPIPESVRDRCTKSHEYIFLLSKSARYFYDADAIKEDAVDHRPRKVTGRTGQERIPNRHGNGHHSNGRFGTNLEGTRNRRDVWTVATRPYKDAHFAVFPPKLIEPCILAGCPVGGVVLDPFGGSGTTAAVAVEHGRNYILCELNPEYIALAEKRINEAMERAGEKLSLEQRVAWLETQVQAQGAKLRKIEALHQQLSLFG